MYVAKINIVRHFLIYIAVLYFEKKKWKLLCRHRKAANSDY